MDKITNKSNIYSNNNVMKGKWIYVKRSKKETDIHYIFKVKDVVEGSNPTEYEVEREFYFTIPLDKECKCFCYDSNDNFILDKQDVLYEMGYDEWLDTFREFVKNDGMKSSDIPAKIIQDR